VKFGPVPIEEASGKLLGHNLAGPDGKRLFRKGKALTTDDVQTLRAMGKDSVYVAELEEGDVPEDQAALRIAQALTEDGLRLSHSAGGRVNLLATRPGLTYVKAEALRQANACEGITVATLPSHAVVRARQIVATVKVIPYAVPEAQLREVESAIEQATPLIRLKELPPKRVGIILSGSAAVHEALQADFEEPLRKRIEALGSTAELRDFISLEDEGDEIALSQVLQKSAAEGFDLVVLAGETAIQDRCDLAPRAILRAGGCVECVGVPVDPGNLLMLAYLGEMQVLGAPGCARSLKTNALDWVLPRLLAGEHLKFSDLAEMGYGGLLEDTGKRPMPRNRIT
jgi:molybdenum cofactor cytidylyltransferase